MYLNVDIAATTRSRGTSLLLQAEPGGFGEERTPNKGIAARETSARTGESPGDDR